MTLSSVSGPSVRRNLFAGLLRGGESTSSEVGVALPRNVSASFSNVRKIYETRSGAVEAVADVSFGVEPGSFVSLLGPSGCGKSTLLLIMAGLLSCTSGQARIGGVEVTGPQTEIGIVFQEPTLLEWRDALGNVMLQIEARGLERSIYSERAVELLDRVGLREFRGKHPRELSGGMKMRVSLCRALVHDPPFLLMDEPFGPLDALTRQQLMLDLHRIWYEHCKTVLFITHSIEEAVFLSDQIVVMTPRPGRIAEVVEVNIGCPRGLDIKGAREFREYVSRIEALFKEMGVLSDETHQSRGHRGRCWRPISGGGTK